MGENAAFEVAAKFPFDMSRRRTARFILRQFEPGETARRGITSDLAHVLSRLVEWLVDSSEHGALRLATMIGGMREAAHATASAGMSILIGGSGQITVYTVLCANRGVANHRRWCASRMRPTDPAKKAPASFPTGAFTVNRKNRPNLKFTFRRSLPVPQTPESGRSSCSDRLHRPWHSQA